MNNEEFMRKHVEAWKRSGLSKPDYASRHNVGYYKLVYWTAKLNKEGKESGRFLPLVPERNDIELTLPSGAVLRMGVESVKILLPILLRNG